MHLDYSKFKSVHELYISLIHMKIYMHDMHDIVCARIKMCVIMRDCVTKILSLSISYEVFINNSSLMDFYGFLWISALYDKDNACFRNTSPNNYFRSLLNLLNHV